LGRQRNRTSAVGDFAVRQLLAAPGHSRRVEWAGVAPVSSRELPSKRARTRAAVAPLPSAIRAQVHALVTGLDLALRTDVARARDAFRAVLGDVQLIEENGAVYAECDNAAELPLDLDVDLPSEGPSYA